MGNNKPYREEGSIAPTKEALAHAYSILSLFMNSGQIGRIASEERKRVEDIRYKRVLGEVGSIEASERARTAIDAPVWQHYGDTIEEGVMVVLDNFYRVGGEFVEIREPLLRSALLTYIEPIILAAMREGILRYTWLKMCSYGFSIEPTKEGEPNAFPYMSVEAMTENDSRAFRLTVEEIYYLAIISTIWETVRRANRDKAEPLFKIYPKDGYRTAEPSESWEGEVVKLLPIVRHRIDEAAYYAIRYIGKEYKQYIDSLNVAEDYDYNRGKGKYNEVMKEGYIWHLGK